jgi:crotonobetaine/carnitine-CoA ligase
MSASVIAVEDDGRGVRVVGLARPDVHNALNAPLVHALLEALIQRPSGTRCVVVHGHGPSFCAGGDRREGIMGPNGESGRSLDALQEITRELQRPDLISIAAVEGWAIGGGAELALACDVVVAGESASFRFPEVELDAHATGGSTWLLPRAVGLHRALLLLLTARALPAAAAMDWGLVAEVVPDGEALSHALALAGALALLPDGSAAALKRSVHDALGGSLEHALVNELEQARPRLARGGFLGPAAGTERG